ncbi:heme/copper-type cytochrome/quinol oxidase subunit 4 [Thalassotalea piscium]|uniref:Heme/copper-type cytochrome/quinol oxidase subunit 4 n=1 Tax=Thalassotalea piscium TaxID=1230533 RepID=A0A7X0NE13_9GAMM|nr:heme/copper-type cytochrome/quinol oxidase subunit 4 [Thalassotalea piscium]
MISKVHILWFSTFSILTSIISMYRFYILNKRKLPATTTFSLVMSIAVGVITAFFCFLVFINKGEVAMYLLTFSFSFITIPSFLSLLYWLLPK